MKKGSFIFEIVGIILLTVLFAGPFAVMLATALKTDSDIAAGRPFWEVAWHWENFKNAFFYIPFARFMANTVGLCIATTLGVLFSSSLAAYAFSRLEWPGRENLFALTIGTIMLPQLVTLIPTFVIFRRLGLVGTYWPLILPAWCGNALFIFLIRQFMLQIPHDLSDAAYVDGASEWQVFLRVIMPLCKPILSVIALMAFVATWNDFLAPLIYVTRYEQFTLSLGLQQFLGQHGAEFPLLMAASTLMMLPILVLFVLLQRHLIAMVIRSGLSN